MHEYGADTLEDLLDEEKLSDEELKEDIGMSDDQIALFRFHVGRRQGSEVHSEEQ